MIAAQDAVSPALNDQETSKPLCHIITPVGMLGYGLDEDQCEDELTRLVPTKVPTAIILDSGSTDSGPAKLALGTMTVPRSSYVRDLTKLMRLVHKYNVLLLFSSAGGDGTDKHVDEMVDVVKEIVEGEESGNVNTKVISIYSDVSKEVVKQRLSEGKVQGCGPPVPTLTEEDIDAAPRIVAQMGIEPYIDAMFDSPDFDVVVGGRSYDPTPYVAFAAFVAMKGQKQPVSSFSAERLGIFFHIGKILECGAQCAIPKGRAVRATIYTDDSFEVTPLEPGARCTALSVAAHTLYEKSRPDILYGPGGCLDLTKSEYVPLLDGKSVRSRGALFHLSTSSGNPYTVKLEGAKTEGYRTMFIGAFKDPILTGQIDSFFDRVQAYAKIQHSGQWELCLHKLGAHDKEAPGEVCVIGEVLASTQELASAVAATARVACIHGPYPGQKATSGNFAFGISGKTEIETGPCAQFCVYHLMDLVEGEERGRKRVEDAEEEHGHQALFTWRNFVFGSQPKSQVPLPLPEVEKEIGLKQSASSDVLNISTITPDTSKAATRKITTLGDAAQVVRSKNAGPYEITFDLIFESAADYNAIKESEILTKETIALLYALDASQIIYCGFFDQALAFKATIPRMIGKTLSSSGGFREDDVHGSQKYLPLMRLVLPPDLASSLNANL